MKTASGARLSLPALNKLYNKGTRPSLVRIPEDKWRIEAKRHSERLQFLLGPGLTSADDQLNTGLRRNPAARKGDSWTALDPKNPIYNFLIEYYGLKGAKGPRRLARWSPNFDLLNLDESLLVDKGVTTLQDEKSACLREIDDAVMEASQGLGGIFLENATEDDLGGSLHLRGAVPVLSSSQNMYGVLYNPAIFYKRNEPIETPEQRQLRLKTLSPFQWYSSILRTTLDSEPILHCHGLHEWAMQYHPPGAPPPPSAKYQSSIPLRVSREVINEAVERRGISCTHVDALRFFAPAAGPLNHHGSELQRTDQLRLEQKGCVHAHMDLLKIALKIQPFIDATLMGDILEVALKSRLLDVEASPYDATAFGAEVVAVETSAGRKVYRTRQKQLMNEAEPIRIRLLEAYETFINLAFPEEILLNRSDENHVKRDDVYIAPERFAKAEPGGLPWRKNLIEEPQSSHN